MKVNSRKPVEHIASLVVLRSCSIQITIAIVPGRIRILYQANDVNMSFEEVEKLLEAFSSWFMHK